MGLGYVYMDLPYGNKKERMEPESALCRESEQGRQSSRLHAADKVTAAIKSLRFHQNTQEVMEKLWGRYLNMGLLFPGMEALRASHTLTHMLLLLSTKTKLASMTCWMVCFNGRAQLQRLVDFFLRLWQVASTPGVSTPG